MNTLQGNIVTETDFFYGEIEFAEKIIGIRRLDSSPRKDAAWIVPGFIDIHFHGQGPYNTEIPDELAPMSQYTALCGTTAICPTLSSSSLNETREFLEETARLTEKTVGNASKILGSHLEGPYLDVAHKGGMVEEHLRAISIDEIKDMLKWSRGTLRLMTLAPELPGAIEAIRFLSKNGITVSMGHTGCSIEQMEPAVNAGCSQVCHLFDTFDGRNVENGVSKPCLADAVLIEDRLQKELICDGVHIPERLIRLAHRASGAEHLISITDAMPGAGLPEGHVMYSQGKAYFMADVARLKESPELILGSALTMNKAFENLVRRFGFTPVEASWMTARNPARAIGIQDRGMLAESAFADIAVLDGNTLQNQKTILEGRTIFER